MPTAKQKANWARFARMARARARSRRKSKSTRRARRTVRRVARSVNRKVRTMPRRSKSSHRRTYKIPVIGTLLGLWMAHEATNGASTSLVTGQFSQAGSQMRSALAQPQTAARGAIAPAAALLGYALVRRAVKPGVKVGPVRIEA